MDSILKSIKDFFYISESQKLDLTTIYNTVLGLSFGIFALILLPIILTRANPGLFYGGYGSLSALAFMTGYLINTYIEKTNSATSFKNKFIFFWPLLLIFIETLWGFILYAANNEILDKDDIPDIFFTQNKWVASLLLVFQIPLSVWYMLFFDITRRGIPFVQTDADVPVPVYYNFKKKWYENKLGFIAISLLFTAFINILLLYYMTVNVYSFLTDG